MQWLRRNFIAGFFVTVPLFISVATLLWLTIIIFSLVGPVPINDRVKAWDLRNLPPDWREQRRRWDQLNAIRVVMIAAAFVALVGSYRTFGWH